MKKHYDFTNARQGELHRPASSLQVPVYLDGDVARLLMGDKNVTQEDVSKLVNAILRTRIGVAEQLK